MVTFVCILQPFASFTVTVYVFELKLLNVPVELVIAPG